MCLKIYPLAAVRFPFSRTAREDGPCQFSDSVFSLSSHCCLKDMLKFSLPTDCNLSRPPSVAALHVQEMIPAFIREAIFVHSK